MVRVPYLSEHDAEGDAAGVLRSLAEQGIRMRILEAVAHSAGAIRSFARMGNSLIASTSLEGRLREIVILGLAAHSGDTYEWYEHETFARREGLDDAELQALLQCDFGSESLTRSEQDAIAFAIAVAEQRLSDEEWERMQSHLDVEQMVDLVLVASWWGGMVPRVVAALGIEPPGDESGR